MTVCGDAVPLSGAQSVWTCCSYWSYWSYWGRHSSGKNGPEHFWRQRCSGGNHYFCIWSATLTVTWLWLESDSASKSTDNFIWHPPQDQRWNIMTGFSSQSNLVKQQGFFENSRKTTGDWVITFRCKDFAVVNKKQTSTCKTFSSEMTNYCIFSFNFFHISLLLNIVNIHFAKSEQMQVEDNYSVFYIFTYTGKRQQDKESTATHEAVMLIKKTLRL